MDEKTFLWHAFDRTDNYMSHGGRGIPLEHAVWSTAEAKIQIDAALVNGYVAFLPHVANRLIITDLGRQRLRALGGFKGTSLEHIRYSDGTSAP